LGSPSIIPEPEHIVGLYVHEHLGQVPRALPLVELRDEIGPNVGVGQEHDEQVAAGPSATS
jgi:hypothetical protein